MHLCTKKTALMRKAGKSKAKFLDICFFRQTQTNALANKRIYRHGKKGAKLSASPLHAANPRQTLPLCNETTL
ncbi:hypothetical protein A7K69_03035 [Parageobacillus thermoglucosidasius]|uniref:Uncharacterized protein n=1 Tax=Parageobacillus thermoglucosidasius TaxID=1426 RepID=A0A1B7KX41_PARTM|nr:hypothetical protein A7K69_03035 [Parageobacillus thermoglucosidasius]